LIRRGLLVRPERRPFHQRSAPLGVRVDVSSVADALEVLEGVSSVADALEVLEGVANR